MACKGSGVQIPSAPLPPPQVNTLRSVSRPACPLRVLGHGRAAAFGVAGTVARRPTVPGYRSDQKAARTSSENSWGCSQAAKWPPRSRRL
jgi:hypothetical protein